MHERDDELLPAVLVSVGVHLGVVLLLVLVNWFTPDSEPVSAAGAPIDAVFVDIGSIDLPDPSEAVPMPQPAPAPEPSPEPEAAPPPSTPPPQPLPEPSPQDAVVEQQVTPQERVPTPDQVEQERVSRLAIERAEAEAEEQEARRIQEQIDLTERQRQQEAEEQQRLARQQAARERLEQLRRERERAAQEADLAAAQTPAPRQPTPLPTAPAVRPASRAGQPAAQPGTNGTDTGLQARYGAAIVAAVQRQWVIPDSVQPNQPCRVRIRQIVGGEVISATADASCPYDAAGRRSIEAAVLRASPLPYAGFESVFNSDINFTFRAPE